MSSPNGLPEAPRSLSEPLLTPTPMLTPKPPSKARGKPISTKAVNRFHNQMDSNPICIIENQTTSEMFLASENQKYFFWVSLRPGMNRFGDKIENHWQIIEIIQN